MKIRPVGAESLHTDRQTEVQEDGRRQMTKMIVAFPTFANAPN